MLCVDLLPFMDYSAGRGEKRQSYATAHHITSLQWAVTGAVCGLYVVDERCITPQALIASPLAHAAAIARQTAAASGGFSTRA